MIANNPEVEKTGTPFGGLKHFTVNIDMEAETMEKVGSIEVMMLDALLRGGIETRTRAEPEALMWH